MSTAISSAQPFKLFRYSDVTTRIDQDLVAEANWLGDLLRNFEARCTEYPVRVSYLADSLRDHSRMAEGIDRWVYSVGQGFERADRGYSASWRLRGQGIFSAQAAAFIDRLAIPGAFWQQWSLALQIFKTKWALNEVILRLRYQVFMLRYAPWFDLARLPWELFKKYQPFLAGALIASSIRLGYAYPGQIIIDLPDFLRIFGFSLREIRTWAGLSGHLTHIKYTNLPSHIFWASLALSIPSLIDVWSSDIVAYGDDKYTGTELASALTVDTVLTLAPVAASYVGAKVGLAVGAKAGALIGTMIAPGAGTVIGGAAGAIIGGVIASWTTKEVVEKTDVRERAIPWLDEHVFGPLANTIASGVGAVSGWIDDSAVQLRKQFEGIAKSSQLLIDSFLVARTNWAAIPVILPLEYPSADEGSGVFGGTDAEARDYLIEQLWFRVADAAELMGLPDVARHMRHYLNGSGEPLAVSPEQMMRDIPAFREKIEGDLQVFFQQILSASPNEGDAFVYDNGGAQWQGFYVRSYMSSNWFYAMGGFQYAIVARVIRVDPVSQLGKSTIDIEYQIQIYDRYNWDEGKSVEIAGRVITDEELGRLHKTGLAQEYDLIGKSEPVIIHIPLPISSEQSNDMFDALAINERQGTRSDVSRPR